MIVSKRWKFYRKSFEHGFFRYQIEEIIKSELERGEMAKESFHLSLEKRGPAYSRVRTGMMRCKKTNPSIAAKCSSILVILPLITGGCTFFQPAPQFTYTIETAEVLPGSPQVSELNVKDQCVDIHVEFEGGGGDNDNAEMVQNDHDLTIKLVNADHLILGMALWYRFTGKICPLGTGDYTLTMVDSNEKLILEKQFTIQSH